jgi:hypothetical protein
MPIPGGPERAVSTARPTASADDERGGGGEGAAAAGA